MRHRWLDRGRLCAPVLLLFLSGCATTEPGASPKPLREVSFADREVVDLALLRAEDGQDRLYIADAHGSEILVLAADEGRELARWPLAAEAETPPRPVALAAGENGLLLATRAPAAVFLLHPLNGERLAELPERLGLRAPTALAAWPLRRGWHTVLVGDIEPVPGQMAPAGVVRVWQMRRRPDGRTAAWRARRLHEDADGAPLSPIRALAEDPVADLSLVLTEPDGRLHRFRSDGTPLGFAPPGIEPSGWRRIAAVVCASGEGFWLALHEDGRIERWRGQDLSLAGRSPPLARARALAWAARDGDERLIVLFPERVAWFRPEALGLGGCAGERPQAR